MTSKIRDIHITWIISKYLMTAGLVAFIFELVKRSDPLSLSQLVSISLNNLIDFVQIIVEFTIFEGNDFV